MQDENRALIPGPFDDKNRSTLGAEQGCMTQIKKGIPIFLALLALSIVFVGVAGGLLAHFTGYFDYQHALDQYDKKDYEEAIEYCTSAVEKNPRYEMAYMLRGSCYLSMGNEEKAMVDFNRAIELKPDMPGAYDLRGLCNLRSNKAEEAIKDFDRAINLAPKFATSYFNRGITYSRLGNSDNAMKDLQEAEKLGFKGTELYAILSEIYFENGNPEKGMEEINKAIRDNPNDPQIYVQRASNYGKMGEYEKADKDFDKALEMGFKNEAFFRNRGATFWRRGNLEGASIDIKAAMEYQPDELYLGIWRYILEARMGKDAKEELVESLKKFGKHDWPEPVALMLMGEISRQECLKKAENNNARLDREQKCEAYFYIAQDCLIKDEKKEAEDYFRKCVSTGVKNFYEYDLAGIELKRFNKISDEKQN